MNATKIRFFLLATVLVLVMAGCHHKQPVAKVTPPPPEPAKPASPTAAMTVTPETVEQGQSVELSWKTENASAVNIEGLGTVAASGSKTLTPNASTTYRLTASGDGGHADASARVTVNPQKQISQITDEQLFAQNVKDVFFSYDNAQVGQDQLSTLNADADFLSKHPAIKLVIEGHCDERGSEDYNMGLGENRASTVKSVLEQHGVGADRVRVISMGKEKPFCTTAEDESCWQQNRRAHFVFSN
jgi:peptidoglycan-associated lipoprotein